MSRQHPFGILLHLLLLVAHRIPIIVAFVALSVSANEIGPTHILHPRIFLPPDYLNILYFASRMTDDAFELVT